jgi:antitoxin (DNA-binding transcriptional repressor) of toxin-antitoxin stability system
MAVTIGGERVARLTDLRRRAKAMIDELKAAKSQQESRVVLTTHGEPVAVLQEYNAYQKMVNLLAETQQQLHIAEARERMRQMNEATMKTVPLQQVITQRTSSSADQDVGNVRG